jgi:Icc-related predicted phosphoesterase
VKIVCISDTHSLHSCINKFPDGDVLIHAGDCTNAGSIDDLKRFNKWLGSLPHRHKLCIAGNHDWCLQNRPAEAEKILTNATYLCDSSVTIDGVKFYGSPFQPEFCDWAFNLPRGGDELREKWAAIPRDTDVLITHGPPDKILDKVLEGERTGCALLLTEVQIVKPRLHVFGHIHEGYGKVSSGDTRFVNASICTRAYAPTNRPIVVTLPGKKRA